MQSQNTAIATEVRLTEVGQQFSRVEEIISFIEKITGEVEAGLSTSILAQRSDAETSPPSAPEPVRVPAAQRLHEIGNRLESVREHLSSIYNRIEA